MRRPCKPCDGIGVFYRIVRGYDIDGQRQAPERGNESDPCDACKGTAFAPCFHCAEPATTDRSGERTCERHAEHCEVCDRLRDEWGDCAPCAAKLKARG